MKLNAKTVIVGIIVIVVALFLATGIVNIALAFLSAIFKFVLVIVVAVVLVGIVWVLWLRNRRGQR